MFYRVRKSWDQPDTQIGAYTVLQNALLQAELNPGYHVFDEKGVLLTPGDNAPEGGQDDGSKSASE